MTEDVNTEAQPEIEQVPAKAETNESTRPRLDWPLTLVMVVILSLALAVLVFLHLWRTDAQRGTVSVWTPEFIPYAGNGFYAVLTSVLFLVVGLSVFGLIRALFPELSAKGDVLFIAVLLIPILTYLLLIGQIANFSAGGVSVHLNNPLGQSVNVGLRPVGEVSETGRAGPAASPGPNGNEQDSPGVVIPCDEIAPGTPVVPAEFTVPRGETNAAAPIGQQMAPPREGSQAEQQPALPLTEEQQAVLEQVQQLLVTPTPTPLPPTSAAPVVFLMLELKCPYTADQLASRVSELAASDSFKFLILVWGKDQFAASIPAGAAVDLLETNAEPFVAAIRDDPELLKDAAVFPGLEFVPVRETDSTLKALRRMQDSKFNALVIVDATGSVAGVVTLEQVTASILLDLATTSE